MNLFNQKLCRERIARFDFPTGEKATQIEKIISDWQYSLKDSDLSKTKEKSIQGSFLIKFFEEILGYPSQTSGNEEWNLIQHPASEVDAQEPDGSLGFFTKGEKVTKAVIELKDAKTLLDKKQSGGKKDIPRLNKRISMLQNLTGVTGLLFLIFERYGYITKTGHRTFMKSLTS